MANRITSLCFDATDAERLAAFWSAVLTGGSPSVKRRRAHRRARRGSADHRLLAGAGRPKKVKNRLHLDVNATDRDQAEELERLLDLGARPVDIGQGDVTWHVLADPEGNEFCLLRSRVQPWRTGPSSDPHQAALGTALGDLGVVEPDAARAEVAEPQLLAGRHLERHCRVPLERRTSRWAPGPSR